MNRRQFLASSAGMSLCGTDSTRFSAANTGRRYCIEAWAKRSKRKVTDFWCWPNAALASSGIVDM